MAAQTWRGVTRRALAGLAFVSSMAGPLAACRPRETGQTTVGPQPSPQAPVTLSFWTRLGPTHHIAVALNIWNEGPGKAKGITLEYTNIPGDQFVDKISAAAAGGSLPDIPTVDLIQGPLLTQRGIYAEITREFNALPYKDKLVPAITRLGTSSGKQYAVPLTGGPSLLYYNKGLLAQAGIDASQGVPTWNELVDYARRVTSPPDRYGIGLSVGSGGGYMYTFMPYVWMNGGDLLSPDGRQVLVDQPPFQEAAQLWVDLAQRYRATPDEVRSATPYSARDKFVAGQIAMFHTGMGSMNWLNQNAPLLEYGVQPMPRSPRTGKTSAFLGGELIGLSATTRYRAQGWEVIQWFLSDDVQVELVLANLYELPVRLDQFDNKYTRANPQLARLVEAMLEGRAPYHEKYDVLFQRADSPLAVNMNAAMSGQKEVRQALQDMKQAMEAILRA